jgi:hypothetical protein
MLGSPSRRPVLQPLGVRQQGGRWVRVVLPGGVNPRVEAS